MLRYVSVRNLELSLKAYQRSLIIIRKLSHDGFRLGKLPSDDSMKEFSSTFAIINALKN